MKKSFDGVTESEVTLDEDKEERVTLKVVGIVVNPVLVTLCVTLVGVIKVSVCVNRVVIKVTPGN